MTDVIENKAEHPFMKKEDADKNVESVFRGMPHPENCVVKRGYFPETFTGDLRGETFVFVNLDPDLYAPIKAGLELFYPLMARGGVILVHNYFDDWAGATKAVNEFMSDNKILGVPIGDYSSIAITKN
jgi:hypothetical protein